jgi:hypothetical protein
MMSVSYSRRKELNLRADVLGSQVARPYSAANSEIETSVNSNDETLSIKSKSNDDKIVSLFHYGTLLLA